MTWDLIVGPEAEAEIAEARDWYDEREPGLGIDFIAVVVRLLQSQKILFNIKLCGSTIVDWCCTDFHTT